MNIVPSDDQQSIIWMWIKSKQHPLPVLLNQVLRPLPQRVKELMTEKKKPYLLLWPYTHILIQRKYVPTM